MKTLTLRNFFYIFSAAKIVLAYPKDVATAFKCSKLVPDVTPCAPNCELQVDYPNANFVYLGKFLTPAEVVPTPGIEFLADSSKYYTLAMVDPDAVGRNTIELRHWLVGNIPGDEVYAGDTLVEYLNPKPPPGTGVHRYAFLVYEQDGYIKFNEPKLNNTITSNKDLQNRYSSISEFAEKYELGCPVFGNYYRSAAEDSKK